MSQRSDEVFDAIVVGGGLAGSSAARDLAEEGRRVLVLEAREHAGGRTFTGKLADSGSTVDFGGSYLSLPHFPCVREEVERYGIELEELREQRSFAYLLGGRMLTGPVPVDPPEILEFERLCFQVLTAAARFDPPAPPDPATVAELDIPWKEFLDGLEPAPAARDIFDAWIATESGRDLSSVSAVYPLWMTAMLGPSVASWHLSAGSRIVGGMSVLIDALLGQPGVELRTGSPVAAVAQDDAEVAVTLADGSVERARTAVIAVPVNCWDRIAFTPDLSPEKRKGTELRPGGHGVKGHAVVEGAPPRLTGMTPSGPITLLLSEFDVDDAQVLCFFGRDDGPEGIDVNDPADVERALQPYAPGCRVRSSEGVAWSESPYSDGSWVGPPVGFWPLLDQMRAADGRLVFASADIAPKTIMYMEGAVESGRAAAHSASELLAADEARLGA